MAMTIAKINVMSSFPAIRKSFPAIWKVFFAATSGNKDKRPAAILWIFEGFRAWDPFHETRLEKCC